VAAFLSRDRIIAGPRFNRWLVPPTALAKAVVLVR
jgi:hypothetical protein